MTDHKLIITPQTKVGELLAAYPEVETMLTEMSPAFKKLQNPILRKTIARIATLQQAAATGNIAVDVVVNTLRQAVGQDTFEGKIAPVNYGDNAPAWFIESKIAKRIDATPIINAGGHPLQLVFDEAGKLAAGEILELETPFLPAPMLEKFKAKGYETHTVEVKPGVVKSYFFKS